MKQTEKSEPSSCCTSSVKQLQQYDELSTKILSNRQVLAALMHSLLPEYADCSIAEIASEYIEGHISTGKMPVHQDGDIPSLITGMDTSDKSVSEGKVVYDILFSASLPDREEKIALLINVEAQNVFNPGYPLLKRAIYYACRQISSQHGRIFTHSHYEKLVKVYSIWICLNPPAERTNTITEYALTEKNSPWMDQHELKENFDLLSVIMIKLGDPENANQVPVLRLLDTLFARQIQSTERSRILKTEFGLQVSDEMEGEIEKMSNLGLGLVMEAEQRVRNEMQMTIDQITREKDEITREKDEITREKDEIASENEKIVRENERITRENERGILSSIKNLCRSLNIDPPKAIELLALPEETGKRMLALLEEEKRQC